MPACATSLASPGGTSAHASSYSTLERSTVDSPRSAIQDPRSTVHGPHSTVHGPRSPALAVNVWQPRRTPSHSCPRPTGPVYRIVAVSPCRRVAVSQENQGDTAARRPSRHHGHKSPVSDTSRNGQPGCCCASDRFKLSSTAAAQSPAPCRPARAPRALDASQWRSNSPMPCGTLGGPAGGPCLRGRARAAMQVQRSISCANHCWLNQLAISDRACQ